MTIHSFAKTYDRKTVLTFPGMELAQDKIYAVIGANGSGKSTFARILAGTLKADEKAAPFAAPAPSIGYLPQKPYLFHMSVKSNLLQNGSGSKSADNQRAVRLMELLNLSGLSDARASRLSGGEAARTALARLLMKDYSLLILDEPAAAMDISSTLQTEALLRDYCHKNHSVILLITHSIRQALRVSNEVLFFREGCLVEYGAAQNVLLHPRQKETAEFLEFYAG